MCSVMLVEVLDMGNYLIYRALKASWTMVKGRFQRDLPIVKMVCIEGCVRPLGRPPEEIHGAALGNESEREIPNLDPPRRFVRENIGVLIDPNGRFDYFALYDMNFSKPQRRAAFQKGYQGGPHACGI